MINLFEMVGAAFTAVFLCMLIAWAIYFVQRNSTIVDLFWSLSAILIAWVYFLTGDGFFFKKLLLALLVTLWAGRLLTILYQRYCSGIEDPRYVELRQQWGGDRSGALFLMLFLFQGFIILALSLPWLIIGHSSEATWSGWEFGGLLIFAIGVIGEALADLQLRNFKSDPANSNGVCNVGLWYFSRHPNYFFEWIVWVGFAMMAFGTSAGWLALFSPLLMLILLLKISGIPPTEAHLLNKYGDSYRAYRETTSAFFPWIPD
jgi:steroid 5-alpha reductase family enzyme